MNDYPPDRRSGRQVNDGPLLLAVLWTIGFLGVAFLVIIRGVPESSNSVTQQLISIMSMIMAAMAGYFYGASKTNSETATQLAASKNKSDEAIQEIAKSAPTVAAAVVAAASNQPVQPIKTDTVNVESETTVVTQPKEPQ